MDKEVLNEILSLVRSKNRMLENLMASAQKVLHKILNTTASDLDIEMIENYQIERNQNMEALSLYDRRIHEQIPHITPPLKQDAEFPHIAKELQRNEQLLVSLIESDEVVFKVLSQAKDQLQAEMTSAQKAKERVMKFKASAQINNGEELDKKA